MIIPSSRSILIFTSLRLISALKKQYPIGHKRRRQEAIPKILEKFEGAVRAQYSPKASDRIVSVARDHKRFCDTPVHEFMSLLAKPEWIGRVVAFRTFFNFFSDFLTFSVWFFLDSYFLIFCYSSLLSICRLQIFVHLCSKLRRVRPRLPHVLTSPCLKCPHPSDSIASSKLARVTKQSQNFLASSKRHHPHVRFLCGLGRRDLRHLDLHLWAVECSKCTQLAPAFPRGSFVMYFCSLTPCKMYAFHE